MEVPEYYYRGGAATGEKQGEHFIVEDLLDFSKDEGEEEAGGNSVGDDGGAAGNSADSSSVVTAVDSCNSSFSGYDPHFSGDLACRSLADAGLSGDFSEPYDQMAELEWLSTFVDDSFSSVDLQTLHLISGIKPSSSTSSSETRGAISTVTTAAAAAAPPSPALFSPEAPVPGKARSKRSRAAPCSWSSRLLVLSPTPATCSSESNAVAPIAAPPTAVKKPSKPAKKKDPSEGPNYAASDGRKCLHCATDKTPQWRTGPMGPKTLCNACGVRYKSGRLVPEYRPAASPTFMLSKHSNSHRKVLELRRQKELQQQQSFLRPGGGGYDGSVGDEFLIHHHIGPDFRQLI